MSGEWKNGEQGLAPLALDRGASSVPDRALPLRDGALPTPGGASPVQGEALPTAGEEFVVGGEKTHAVIHRMTRRCWGWDYRQRAIYMITLVQRDRREPLLGRLEVADGRGGWVTPVKAKSLGLRPEQIEARVVLSELGAAILAHWKRIGDYTPEIKPLYCQIMPDHLHAILEVTRPMARPLGNAIGGFKTGCEKIYRELALSAQNKELALSAKGKGGAIAELGRLWAEGFQDSILFRDGQLENMFNYQRDNPRRLAIKRLFPDLFRVVSELRVGLVLRLAPQTQHRAPQTQLGALQAQHRALLAQHEASQPRLQGVEAAGVVATAQAVGCFAALGNRFLLDGQLLQVQVSRSDFRYKRMPKPGGGLKIARDEKGVPQIDFTSAAFDQKCERLLAAAKHGTTLISPCVSDGEREIARRALEARLKLVTLANKGFSPLAKPSGRYFDACADGRLLMLAPAAWPYVPGEKKMTREDALVLNRLAQALAGVGAAEINYHGVTFEHVDDMALRAVKGGGDEC